MVVKKLSQVLLLLCLCLLQAWYFSPFKAHIEQTSASEESIANRTNKQRTRTPDGIIVHSRTKD